MLTYWCIQLKQIATLQAKLEKRLGPEFISQCPGPGSQGKLTCVEGFGFNGWSSSITSLAINYVCTHKSQCAYNGWLTYHPSRLTTTTKHSDIASGSQQLSRSLCAMGCIMKRWIQHTQQLQAKGYRSRQGTCDSSCYPMVQRQLVPLIPSYSIQCKKEAVTDALKHTNRNFGNILNHCLYDKEYAKVCLRLLSVTWYPFLTNPTRKWSRFNSRHQSSTGPSSITVQSIPIPLQAVI